MRIIAELHFRTIELLKTIFNAVQAMKYLSASAAISSMRHTAFLHNLSPMASEAPCSSTVFSMRPWANCSLLETTCQHSRHML